MQDQVYQNNAGLSFIILAQAGKSCTINFIKSGSTRKANIDNVRAGKVKDLYSPSRYGIGYLGEFERVSYFKQAMQLWSNMLKRCYAENDAKGYFGKGVTVDPRWHCFANFLQDLPHLPNFSRWLDFYETRTDPYNLDKEFYSRECKVYSKYTCGFETEHKNKQAGKLGKQQIDGVWVTTKP